MGDHPNVPNCRRKRGHFDPACQLPTQERRAQARDRSIRFISQEQRSMGLWNSLKFGTRTVYLQHAASRSRAHIERVQRRRLRALVRHARASSEYYRERFANVDEANFELTDLAPSTKIELMENFDRVVTVPDIRRTDLQQF